MEEFEKFSNLKKKYPSVSPSIWLDLIEKYKTLDEIENQIKQIVKILI